MSIVSDSAPSPNPDSSQGKPHLSARAAGITAQERLSHTLPLEVSNVMQALQSLVPIDTQRFFTIGTQERYFDGLGADTVALSAKPVGEHYCFAIRESRLTDFGLANTSLYIAAPMTSNDYIIIAHGSGKGDSSRIVEIWRGSDSGTLVSYLLQAPRNLEPEHLFQQALQAPPSWQRQDANLSEGEKAAEALIALSRIDEIFGKKEPWLVGRDLPTDLVVQEVDKETFRNTREAQKKRCATREELLKNDQD